MTQLSIFYENETLTEDEYLARKHQELASNPHLRNETQFCPICRSRISDRQVTLYRELIDSLYAVYCWCGKNKRHEFTMKDIRHMLSRNNYARFGDLIRFGGLVYKPKEEGVSHKALYGLNMARCKEFFHGDREIPVMIILNQITNEIEESKYISVKDFPKLSQLLTEQGIYDYEMSV